MRIYSQLAAALDNLLFENCEQTRTAAEIALQSYKRHLNKSREQSAERSYEYRVARKLEKYGSRKAYRDLRKNKKRHA